MIAGGYFNVGYGSRTRKGFRFGGSRIGSAAWGLKRRSYFSSVLGFAGLRRRALSSRRLRAVGGTRETSMSWRRTESRWEGRR